MNLQITGLTAKQKALCEIIWACDSQEQVVRFVASLPARDRREAQSMVEMMTWAFFDTVDTVDDSVKSLIDKFRV